LCKVLLIVPSFSGQSFWNFRATCEVYGARLPAAPLGLITVAALLPSSWQCRLANRNTEDLLESDLNWADLVMTGGMLPQQPDTLRVIERAHARQKPEVVGGPDVTSSPEGYRAADFQVLGEAEGAIDLRGSAPPSPACVGCSALGQMRTGRRRARAGPGEVRTRSGDPGLNRSLSPWVISTVSHSPEAIAAAAWPIWIINERPATAVPSTHFGVRMAPSRPLRAFIAEAWRSGFKGRSARIARGRPRVGAAAPLCSVEGLKFA
jgi:hypothetical protein